jgi:hypothetical protein
MLGTSECGCGMFFHRGELIVRCAYRGLALSVPDHDRLLNACAPGERRRLQRLLGRPNANGPGWLIQWHKNPGDLLQPNDVVATLSRDGVVVELAYAQGGTLAERLAGQDQGVGAGKRLARLERRAKEPPPPTVALIRQYVARQREDAKTIATLEAQLAMLQAHLTTGPGMAPDAKFKRLKHEFSRRYHPDTRLPGDEERLRRERVFQEFWPIVEEIERS